MTAATAPTYGNLVNGAFVGRRGDLRRREPGRPRRRRGALPGLRPRPTSTPPCRPPAPRCRPGARRRPCVRGRHLLALARELRAEEATIVPAITREQGKPLAESRGEFLKTLEYLEYYGALAYEYGGRLLPSARPGVELSGAPRAARRRRAADAVERAARDPRAQARAGPPVRQHGGHQAVHGDAAVLPRDRRGRRSGRPPGRRDQRRARPGRDHRPGAGRAPPHRRHLVHGLHRGRPADRAGRCRAAR